MFISFNKKFKFFFLFFLLILLNNLMLAKDSIIWLHPDFPPSYILKGEFKGQGSIDAIHKKVFSFLDEYEHKTSVANFKRITRNLKNEDNSCAIALLWNKKRSEVIHFSNPHFLVHPVRLIIKKEDLKEFEMYKEFDDTYSLEAILKDGKFLLGYSLGRSYSKGLDLIIEEFKTKQNSTSSAQVAIFRGLLKMLSLSRIDYTLAYSHELNYVANELLLNDKFLSLPIYGANSLIPVHVGCPQNEWGEKIIEKLNPYFMHTRKSREYYGSYLRWLSENEREDYIFLINEYFKDK